MQENLNDPNGVWQANGEIGEKYDDLCLRMRGFMDAQRQLALHLAAHFRENPCTNPRMLEVGIGTGITTDGVLMNCDGSYVTAVEPDGLMIERARKRLVNPRTKNRIEFVCKDFVSFCSPTTPNNERWHAAYSAFTLHNLHSSEQARIITAVHQMLLPGGLFVLADYAIQSPSDRIPAFKKHTEELFDILGSAKDALGLLRGWVLHSYDDMNESRVKCHQDVVKCLGDAGFVDIQHQFTGRLEAVFQARRPA